MKIDRIHWASFFLTLCICLGLWGLSARYNDPHLTFFGVEGKTINHSEPKLQEQNLRSTLSYVSGEIRIYPQENTLFEFDANYKIAEVEPLYQFISSDNATLSIGMKRIQSFGIASQSQWELGLNKNVVHDLTLNAKASKHYLDLSGIPLRSLELNSGTSKVDMVFHTPNPVSMDSLKISSGASDCKIFGLANANAKHIELDGKAGLYLLDFSGQQTVSTQLKLQGGVSKAVFEFPKSANVRLTIDNRWFTAKSIDGFIKKGNRLWESRNFDETKAILDIVISIGTGKLTFKTI